MLKNSVSRRPENSWEFIGYLVRESQIDCDVLSCVRPDFHATSATPLVTTVRNAAQIANEIVAHFKKEFFNSIPSEADIQLILDKRSAKYCGFNRSTQHIG